MLSKTLIAILCFAFLLLCCAESAKAQWIPRRVVGMEYTDYASSKKIQGDVIAICTLNSDGSVISVTTLGNTHPVLLLAAKDNAAKWIFVERSIAEFAPRIAILIYSFRLEGEAAREQDIPRHQFVFEYPSKVNVISEYWNHRLYDRSTP